MLNGSPKIGQRRYGTDFILCLEGVRPVESMTISRVAKRAGVGVETIRFCEREGLIEEPPRRGSGYREYPVDTVERVRESGLNCRRRATSLIGRPPSIWGAAQVHSPQPTSYNPII